MAEEKEYTPAMVWRLLTEIGEKQKESAIAAELRAAEWERERKESAAEWERRNTEYEKARKESNAEWEKRMKEIRNNIGGISDSNGAMAEEAIFNVLEKDKIFADVKFDEMFRKVPVMAGFKTKTELDILMVNGDTISIIETKYKVEKKDINDILHKKLIYFRECRPEYKDYKVILGVGGMSFEDNAIEQAQQNGVGIIKIVGNKVEFHTDGIRIY